MPATVSRDTASCIVPDRQLTGPTSSPTAAHYRQADGFRCRVVITRRRSRVDCCCVATAGHRAWTEKHREYRGLLPEGGRLQLPAIYGLGLAWDIVPAWTVAIDYQRFEYTSEKAFGNRLAQLAEGHRLGSDDGPGFGFRNHNVYKLGLRWRYSPVLTLHAGAIRANGLVPPSETLFGFFGVVMNRMHYTIGATYGIGDWELSGFFAHAPSSTVRGENSIPPELGGGEADLSFRVNQFGFSVGRTLTLGKR